MAKRKHEDSPSFDEPDVSLNNNRVISQIKCDATNRIEPRIIKYIDEKTHAYKTIKVSRIPNDTGQDTLKILVTDISTQASCEYEFKNIKDSGYEHINNHLILHLIAKGISSNCELYGTHIIPGEYLNLGGPSIKIGEYIKIGCTETVDKLDELNKKQSYRIQQITRDEHIKTLKILIQNISEPDSKLIIREFQTINKDAYDKFTKHMMLHIIGAIGDYSKSNPSCTGNKHIINNKYIISDEHSNTDEANVTFPYMLTLTAHNSFPFLEIDASLMGE